MAGTTVTDARKKVFTFSDTYYDTSIVIYTRSNDKVSDYKQLKGKTVGVKNGTAAQTWLDKNASKYGFTVKTFDTSDLMNKQFGLWFSLCSHGRHTSCSICYWSR